MPALWRSWRWFIRLVPAVLALFAQGLAVILLASTTILATRWVAEIIIHEDAWGQVLDHRWWLAWPLLVVPVITGAWLRATFNHWRYGMQWVTWAALIFATLTFGWLVLPWWRDLQFVQFKIGTVPRPTAQDNLPLWANSVLVLAVMMLVSLAGAPLGKGILLNHQKRRRARWRKRRQRFRARGLSR